MHVVRTNPYARSARDQDWRAAIRSASTGEKRGFQGKADVDRELWVKSESWKYDETSG
jgi:hypothetical protein